MPTNTTLAVKELNKHGGMQIIRAAASSGAEPPHAIKSRAESVASSGSGTTAIHADPLHSPKGSVVGRASSSVQGDSGAIDWPSVRRAKRALSALKRTLEAGSRAGLLLDRMEQGIPEL